MIKISINVIFDMDGVLLNSEPIILKSAITALKEFGVNATPIDFKPFVGAGEDRFVGGVAEKYGVPYKIEMKKRTYELYSEFAKGNLMVYDGTIPLLKRLYRENYVMAIASSADRFKVDINLKEAGIQHRIFNKIITGDDVAFKKPSPEIYLKAAELIGKTPESCVVVEDALNGIIAAKNANMRVIALCTSFDEKTLQTEKPDFIAKDISGVYDIVKGL